MPAKKKKSIMEPSTAKQVGEDLSFAGLVKAIQRVHEESSIVVNRVVNATLTLRNWFIGNYIVEYELKGVDRAKYGEQLIPTLAEELARLKISRCDRRELFRYQRFYRAYPQIVETVSPQFEFHGQPALRLQIRRRTAIESRTGKLSPYPASGNAGRNLIPR